MTQLLVHTETGSKHFIDTTELTYMRVPDQSGSVSELRGDGEKVPVHSFTEPRVGEPLTLLLSKVSHNPTVATQRVTSRVTLIETLDE